MEPRVHRRNPAGLETSIVTRRYPLCVDLDGTLIHSDTLLESMLDGMRRNPIAMLALPSWILEGRARLKERIAGIVRFDATSLPYREDLLTALREARAEGRELVLVTAANRQIAAAVAAHLGIFDRVIASTATVNLKGEAKRAALDQAFGEGGYDYVGDSTADLAVWAGAHEAWVAGAVEPPEGIPVARRFAAPDSSSIAKAFLQALRPYQWVKNVLIFLPLLLGHQWLDWRRWAEALVSFVAFSLVASAGYLINDALDRRDDRKHARKKHRPFASGALPLHAVFAAPVLLVTAMALCLFLPVKCELIIGAYFVATLSYSLSLKKMQLVDVMTLACLYSSRLVMGSEATQIPISLWLLRFSLFMFLTLALAKRVAELRMLQHSVVKSFGRGYRIDDLPILETMGVAAGYIAALVMVLYVESSDVALLYPHPIFLWLILPVLLFWISHLWLVAHRGELPDDPILFAFRDRRSLLSGVAAAVCVLAASL